MSMICTVAICKEDGVFIAKDIRTSVTDQGNTMEEALSNLKEALELYYDDNDGVDDEPFYTTSLEVCV